jgi:hypothetical protein
VNVFDERRETGDKADKPGAMAQAASSELLAASSKSRASGAKIFYPFFVSFVFDFESGGIPEPIPLKLMSPCSVGFLKFFPLITDRIFNNLIR